MATGSGRTLKQLRAAFPKEKITGIDLSDSYLKEASRYISDLDGDLIQLIKGNAEELPFENDSFQCISCVYLFHELPRTIRAKVLNEFFRDRKKSSIKILDVATGSGRTLKQLRAAFPKEKITGIDLSDSYLKEASRYISDLDGDLIQLIKGNAEDLPFKNDSIQCISCVYLFHELPRKIRAKVLNEFFRVLEPG